jgi:hypothetical protein
VLHRRRYLLRLQFGKLTNSGEANGVIALSLGKEADAATGKAREKNRHDNISVTKFKP